MSDFYCTIGNKCQSQQNPKKINLHIGYDSKDPNYEMSNEEVEILLDLIEPRLAEIFTDAIEVFPEITGLEISINESNNNS